MLQRTAAFVSRDNSPLFEIALVLVRLNHVVALLEDDPGKEPANGPPEKMPEKNRRHSAASTKLRLSDVACYAWLSSRSWSCERSLRELPDREDDTEDKGHKNCNLENAATFLLRPDH